MAKRIQRTAPDDEPMLPLRDDAANGGGGPSNGQGPDPRHAPRTGRVARTFRPLARPLRPLARPSAAVGRSVRRVFTSRAGIAVLASIVAAGVIAALAIQPGSAG